MTTQRLSAVGLVALIALVGTLALGSGKADAGLGEFSLVHSFQAGQILEGLAVDESSNDIYVYEPNSQNGPIILKFDAEGNPVPFSALGGNEIAGIGAYGFGETELAVDNSDGPAKGDIYLAGGQHVQIFSSAGIKLGEITQASGQPWGEEACGVAVDGSGNVYIGLYEPGVKARISEYSPTANPVTDSDYVRSREGLDEICEIAASPTGALYAATWNPDREGAIFGMESIVATGAREITPHGGGSLTVAKSPAAELFFADEHDGQIQQDDSLGNPLSTFVGEGYTAYSTMAINAKNGRLYAASARAKGIEVWQGTPTPEVHTSAATGLSGAGSATLNGTVDAEGASVETCSFEYGLSASYGSAASCAQPVPLTGSSTQAVSADIAGLLINHEYHYRLSTTDVHGTIAGADRTFTIPVLPRVEDQQPSASSITRSTVTLAATVDPEEAETSVYFEYGTSESYGNDSAFSRTDAGAVDMPVVQQVTDLLPDTTYHYRLVAKNVAGLVDGADHTFTTGASTPPGALTGGPAGVTQNGATITGTVDAKGLPTTYGFEIGTSTNYGPPTGLGPVGAGLSKESVSLQLTGLLPGTTYHYRITAANIDGTTYGTDQTFTTSVFASTFAEPPAPLPFVTVPQIAFPSEAKPIVKKPVKKKAKIKVKKRGKSKKKAKNKKKKK